MKKILTTVLVLVLILGMCVYAHAEVTTVKIGVIEPLTGGSARNGEMQMGGINYAVEYVNETLGGIESLGGAKIELVVADSTGSAEVGASEAERLINSENVDAIIGTYNSGVAAAVVPICEKYGVPFMIINATSDNILEGDLHYSVRANNSNSDNAICYANFITAINALGVADEVENFAIVYENTDWGVGVNQDYGNALMEAGYNIAISETFESGSADFSSIVNKIKNEDVDAILPAMYVSDANLFVQQLAEYDVNVPIIGAGGGMLVDDFLTTVGDYAEYILTINGWSWDTLASKPELAREIDARCLEELGTVSNENIANGWLGIMLLYEAFNNAGTTDKDAVAEALVGTDIGADDIALLFHPFQGVDFGEVRTMTNQNIYSSAVITQVIDGAWRLVFDGTTLYEDMLVYPQPTFEERGL